MHVITVMSEAEEMPERAALLYVVDLTPQRIFAIQLLV